MAVRPKPIERQNVSTCLKVFSEQTYTAIMSHPSFQNRDDFKETGEFIRSVKDMWSILNIRSKFKDERHLNPLEAVVQSKYDTRLGISS